MANLAGNGLDPNWLITHIMAQPALHSGRARRPGLRIHVIDLDGSLRNQPGLAEKFPLQWTEAERWGPAIRLACGFRRFGHFERWLADQVNEDEPSIAF